MKIASIFLAVLASTSVRASTNSPVDVILSRGCGGNYQLLPKLPFGMSIDVPTLEHAFTGIFTKLRDRAKCQCPSLSDNDFDLLFDPITGALNAASSNTKYPAGCPGLFPRNITDFADVINVNLPSTCTLDLWQTEGQCSMKYDWSPQVTFGVAIKKCPASPIPAITINCLGCTDLAKPCSTDSDCGKHKCNSVTNWASHQDTVMNLFENFKNAHLFDDGDAQPGCSQNKFQPTSANDMLTSALSFIKNEIYGDGGDVPELKFCGIDQFSNANMTGLMTLVDQPLTPPRCYLPEYSSGKNMTITYLQPWADGQNFLNASPIVPAPNLSNAPIGHFRILQTSCDGQFMLMNGAIRVRMAHAFIRTFEKFDKILYAMQKCRRDGSLMLRQFLTRFGMWTLYPYMYSMDGSTYPDQFFLGPSMSDWVTNMFTRHTATQSYQKPNFIYGLPETCDFQNLLKTGGCNVQFNGISSLLNMDVQAELHVATCASSTGDTPMFIQSLAVDMTCGGDWNCSETTFISCETNYDCPTNMQCLDFKKMLPLASGDVIGDYFFPIRNKNIQPEKFSGTLCSSSNVGYDSDTTCGSPLKTDQDMSYVVAQLVGMDPSKMSQKGGIKMCSFDQQAFNSTSLSNWAMTQVQSKENGFVVANLKSISAPSDLLVGSATPQEDPQTQNSSDGSMFTASGGVGFAALFFAYLLI